MTATLSPPRRPGLPEYDAYQHSFHEAFRPELYAALDTLPLPPDAAVLDVPCGDGFYAAHLAGRAARLVAADASDAYLDLARETLAGLPSAQAQKADVYDLPFDDDTFDLTFCAQSLISLDDPLAALAEMVRVTKPGGHVAVLECDEFHHVLLPWPVDLELTVARAFQARGQHKGEAEEMAPARWVRGLMQRVKLRGVRRRTFAADRAAPFGEWEAEFLARHQEFLAQTVREHLSADDAERLAAADFSYAGAEMTCLNALHVGRKPRAARPHSPAQRSTLDGRS